MDFLYTLANVTDGVLHHSHTSRFSSHLTTLPHARGTVTYGYIYKGHLACCSRPPGGRGRRACSVTSWLRRLAQGKRIERHDPVNP
jgi:hypothetical protein